MNSYLLMVWVGVGIVCFIPFFSKSKAALFLAPLIMLSVYGSFYYSESQIGRPYYDKPAKFLYQHHKVDTIDNQKWITLLAIVDGDDRLYRFPYDKKTEEELKRAQERGKSGTPQVGEFKNNKKKKGVDRNMQDLKMYDLPHTKIVPKAG